MRRAPRGSRRDARAARSSACRSTWRWNRPSPTCRSKRMWRCPTSPRGRRDDPLHLGINGRFEGRAVDTPRGHQWHLCLFDRPDGVARTAGAGWPGAGDAAHTAQRPAVPRDGRSSGHAQQLRRRALHGGDAQMGCRGSPAIDRKGADHLFRRGSDHEPRADDPSRPAPLRSLVAQGHHCRRSPAPGQPRRAAPGANSPMPSRRSATGSRRPMPSAASISGAIMPTSPPRPAARRGLWSKSRFSARKAPICPSVRSARSRSGAPPTSNPTGVTPTRRRRCSRPTATSAPVTSATSTGTAICSSSTARRTSSFAAARTSPRPRSRRLATPTRRLPK